MTLYDVVKFFHVSAILLSISGFTFRAVLKLRNSPLLKNIWLKKLPHFIDSILLITALWMVFIININPFTTPWIAEKLIGLCLYILLGMVALHWAKTKTMQVLSTLSGICLFIYIMYVAHSKVPVIFFS